MGIISALEQWFSKGVHEPLSVSITLALAGNAHSQAPPHTYWTLKILGVGPRNLGFNKPPGDVETLLCLRTTEEQRGRRVLGEVNISQA